MSVVYLNDRVTKNRDEYKRFFSSQRSLIYLDVEPTLDPARTTLDLHVGDEWFDCRENCFYAMGEDGLVLKPGWTLVIQVKEELALPSNVFGLVMGKGKLIFQGVFISSGKIDPSFQDKLRIGVYNGGPRELNLKPGDPLCGCSFFSTESHNNLLSAQKSIKPNVAAKTPNRLQRLEMWNARNWRVWVPIAIASIAALGTVANAVVNYVKFSQGR